MIYNAGTKENAGIFSQSQGWIILAEALKGHENKKRYGYRRITKELHNNDICVNHKTVQKLMKQLGLVCRVRAKRKYNSYKGEVGEVAPNLLERHFKTNQPNRKWVTDVTEFKVNDQKLYLSPILDLFNGEVVSPDPNAESDCQPCPAAFEKHLPAYP